MATSLAAEAGAALAIGDRAASSRTALLAKVDLFSGLDRVSLAKLAASLDPVEFADLEPACTQGDPGDSMYIVSQGSLGVFIATPGSGPSAGDSEDTADAARTDLSAAAGTGGSNERLETRVAVLGAGTCFGEMALLTGEPRSATVRALGPAEALRLDRTRFIEVLRREPTIGLSISATLSRRLGQANRDILLVERHLAERVAQGLDHLRPAERERVLRAGVLEDLTPGTLGVLFGEHAEEVAAHLHEVGVTNRDGTTTATGRAVLRGRLEEAVGKDVALAIGQHAALALEEAGLWHEALAVSAQAGDRHAFLDRLERALIAESVSETAPESGSDTGNDSAATLIATWIEQFTDDEAERRPLLALARARWHEQHGERATALALLHRALDVSSLTDQPEMVDLLGGAIAQFGLAVRPQKSPSVAVRLRRVWERSRRSPKVVIAAIATVGFTAAAAQAGHTSQAWGFILLLCAAVALWVTAVLPEFAVSLGLLAAWVLVGVATSAQAVAGFGTSSWVTAFAILGLASAISTSGLLFRFGLLLVRRLPRGLFGQATFLATGILLTPLMPSSTARSGLAVPLALTASEAQRLEDRGPESAFLGLAAYVGCNPLLFMFLNGSTSCLLALGLLPEAVRARMDFTTWFIATLPLGLIVAVGTLLVMVVVLRPGNVEAISHVRLNTQLTLLGAITPREVAMTVILLLTVVGWNAGPMIGLSPTVIVLMSLMASVLVGAFTRQSLQGLNWDFLVSYGVVLAISQLMVHLGVDAMAAHAIGSLVGTQGVSPVLFVLGVAVLNLIVRIFLPQDQALLLMSLALVPSAPVIGISPWVISITLLATFSTWFFPTQTVGYLVAREAAEGRLYTDQQAFRVCAGYTVVTLLGLAVSVPYWHLLGLA